MKLAADFLTSRKAQALLCLVVISCLTPNIIDPVQAESISQALMVYIVGRGLADIKK